MLLAWSAVTLKGLAGADFSAGVRTARRRLTVEVDRRTYTAAREPVWTGGARYVAELAALLGAALLFGGFHLDGAQRLIGHTGEPFHGGAFLWRVSAGILLGALFRWRGLGVSAWAHAVYNLALALGLGPG